MSDFPAWIQDKIADAYPEDSTDWRGHLAPRDCPEDSTDWRGRLAARDMSDLPAWIQDKIADASPADSTDCRGLPPGSTRTMLKLHVSGVGGPICSVSLDPASKLKELKSVIAASSGIPSVAQRLFHGTEELVGKAALAGLLPPGTLEETLLLVRRSPEEIAELGEQ